MQALTLLALELHYWEEDHPFFANSAENLLKIFGRIKAAKAFDSVTFTVEYSNNANTLYFDHMRLYSGELYGNLLLQR